jgi:hypothetical protein
MSSVVVNNKDFQYHPPQLIEIPGNSTENGSVHFWENVRLFPQGILRCFWISGVKESESRGNHAHWQESQVLVALAGKLHVKVTGTAGTESVFVLEEPCKGLLVPPLNWVEIHFSVDAVLLGLGDRVFSENDYIRDKKYFGSIQ